MTRFFIFVALPAIILSSCSNKLDRDTAAKLIKEQYQYPNVETAEINLEEFGRRDESILQDAVKKGYLRFSKNGYAAYGMMGSGNVYSITKKASPFFLNKEMGFFGLSKITVVTNCREFYEITGIKENDSEKTALVEFSCKRKGVTPLGEAIGYKEGDIVNYKVSLTLYDDGWRITDKKSNVNPEKYSYFDNNGNYIEQEYLSCDSENELWGKLIGVYHLQDPCAYPYFLVETEDSKKVEIYLDMNSDEFKVNNDKFFKWSQDRIYKDVANDPTQMEVEFPKEAFDIRLLNKTVLFCFYKGKLDCGDDPNAPAKLFCKKILASSKVFK